MPWDALQNRLRAGANNLKDEVVPAFRQFHNYGIVCSFSRIVVGEFEAQAPSLHAHARIRLRIKIPRATENFGRNLVLLQMYSRMIERMLRQIPQQLAK